MKKSTIWILGIIGFILICFCCLFFKIPSIENELAANSKSALNNAGIRIDSLSISGRDITLTGIVPSQDVKVNAGKIVSKIWGVNSVYNNLEVLEKPKQIQTEISSKKNEKIQKIFDEIIKISNIQFESASSIIKPVSFTILDKVVTILNENPEIKISVNGYTDSSGNENTNKILSKQRAESVKTYLVKHGILNSRITALGFGSLQPIADNKTLEGRKKNRRVEFKIIQEN